MKAKKGWRRFFLRWLNPTVWSHGFGWGFKLGRLSTHVAMAFEYKRIRHAPKRARRAVSEATKHFAPERHRLLKEMGIESE